MRQARISATQCSTTLLLTHAPRLLKLYDYVTLLTAVVHLCSGDILAWPHVVLYMRLLPDVDVVDFG